MTGADSKDVKLLYFAWVREKIGLASETVTLPNDIETVSDLVAWLRSRGDNYQAAFAKDGLVRAALDQRHVRAAALIGDAREIAFFPPVTGG